ncbi:MAG: zinc-dependent metalloprotease, partial [Candidatus Kapabacteria bacterium]|nr:zinc-dependent metalloprotease [Candidatus Kapabacteria bacterium]
GHTIGMPHNMKASSAYPVDSLRSKTFCAKYGTAPSIMDYARFNYIAQPGDDVDVMPKVGPYDKFATMWGYRPVIGAKTSDDELDSTRAWAQATERDPMLRFGSQQWMILDPSSQTEDLGDDALKAGMYGVQNLQRAIGYLFDATFEAGKDFDQLNDSYDDIVGQWSREMGHVANIPGGVYIDRKVFGSEGAVYTPVPQARQKAAVTFMKDYVFTTPTWLIDDRVMRLLSPTDVASRLSSLQTRMLRTVISSDKLLRLLDQQARYGDTAYSVDELYADVEGAILTELTSNKPTDYYRRALHRTYVQELIDKSSKPAATTDAFAAMFRSNTYATDVRAISRARLAALRKRLQAAKSADPTTQAHYEDLSLQIRLALEEPGTK